MVECLTCHRHVMAGDSPYQNASRGEECLPEQVYADSESTEWLAYYCSECAAKLSVNDPTRAVNQYFSDTAGNKIEPEHLLES